MGLVLQAQRRALEVFAPYAKARWPEETFERSDARFFLGTADTSGYSDSLVCVGISSGIGTCSDLQGVDIAVLQYHQEIRKRQQAFLLDYKRLSGCRFAVLLWPDGSRVLRTTSGSRAPGLDRVDPAEMDPIAPLRILELLEFSSFEKLDFGTDRSTHVYLTRTGLISSYIPIYYVNDPAPVALLRYGARLGCK